MQECVCTVVDPVVAAGVRCSRTMVHACTMCTVGLSFSFLSPTLAFVGLLHQCRSSARPHSQAHTHAIDGSLATLHGICTSAG